MSKLPLEAVVGDTRGRSKLPWILGGVALIALCCGCFGGIGAFLYWRSSGGGLEGARGGDAGEWLARRRAATSGKGHKDPFSAPDGAIVHVGQGEVMGPSARDTEILDGLLRRSLPGPEVLDALPDRPYAVNLYQDPGSATVSRVSLDLDRDGKADELWKVEGTRVRRAVSTADDEDYDRMWLWQNGLWLAR